MNVSVILSFVVLGLASALVSGKVLIYHDAGVSDDMLGHLFASLSRSGYSSYRRIGPTELAGDCWHMGIKVLVFPDGREDCYGDALEIRALNNIRNWAEAGGNVLGIGAGSYFASTFITFKTGDASVLRRNGPLRLYPYGAYGPVSHTYTRNWEDNPRPASITLTGDGKHAEAIYMYATGSCYFDAEEVNSAGWEVLAVYSSVKDTPPAIISGRVGAGQGTVILSGPNWTADHEQMTGLETTGMYQDLFKTFARRREFAESLLDSLAS